MTKTMDPSLFTNDLDLTEELKRNTHIVTKLILHKNTICSIHIYNVVLNNKCHTLLTPSQYFKKPFTSFCLGSAWVQGPASGIINHISLHH